MIYYFIDNCPSCRKAAILNIIGWQPLYSEYGDGGAVSFAIQCTKCKRHISGLLNYPEFGALMDEDTLRNHANASGDVSRIFKDDHHIDFSFDLDKRNAWHMENTLPSNPEFNHLMMQVNVCMKNNCWDAVGLLCRKTIEMAVNKLIKSVDIDKLNEKITVKTDKVGSKDELMSKKLLPKIRCIFPPETEGNNRPDIYHQAQLVRLSGNIAAHEDAFTQKESDDIYRFTVAFLNNL